MGFDLSDLDISYIFNNNLTNKILKNFKNISAATVVGIAMLSPISANNYIRDITKQDYEVNIRNIIEDIHKQDSIKNELKAKEEFKQRVRQKINDKRIEDVVDNAWDALPKSRPYLELIADANRKYSKIFEVPVEYHIGLLMQESLYDPKALSFAGALGMGQMMRYTAEDLGMKVYSPKKFPKAYANETKLMNDTKRLYALSQNMKNSLDAEDFKSYVKYKRERTKLRSDLFKLLEETKVLYKDITMEDDDRLNPEIMIDLSAKHLAQLSKRMYNQFGGRKDHAALRALAAYNSGSYAFDNDGLPMIEETVKYVRIIMRYTDKMYPGYETLPVFGELPYDYSILMDSVNSGL